MKTKDPPYSADMDGISGDDCSQAPDGGEPRQRCGMLVSVLRGVSALLVAQPLVKWHARGEMVAGQQGHPEPAYRCAGLRDGVI